MDMLPHGRQTAQGFAKSKQTEKRHILQGLQKSPEWVTRKKRGQKTWSAEKEA